MTNNVVEIINVTSCELPLDSKLKRHSPRKEDLKSQDYDEKFDFTTLAFDVFMSDDKLVFSGPPAYGLEDLFNKENFYLNGQPLVDFPEVHRLDRTQRNWIFSRGDIRKFKWVLADIEFYIDVNLHQQDLFRNKKVLFTLSKNNKFEWISDWIRFYKEIHNIDAVLFYDNNSDNYSLEDLKEYLVKEHLNVDIVLIPWNFKYGPQGGVSTGLQGVPWDSDFCQYGMMEHAKERFLKYAAGVINVDVDELIVNKEGTSIFDELGKTDAIHIKGKWIESISLDKSAPIRFNNFFYFDKNNYRSDFKWCIAPQRVEYNAQWKVHTVKMKKIKQSKSFYYFHYKPVNYNWKVKRADFVEFDKKVHRFDYDLYAVIKKVFPVGEVPEIDYKLSFLEKLRGK